MTALLLRLAGPLQSWGTGSRFTRRNTDRMPSRSGVIGLLASATGRRRTDPLEDLLELRIGVRIDQPGKVERDFQTARTRDGAESMPLSQRFYLADAVFAVAVEGDLALLEGLRAALRRPVYPLFLGRKSCPPAGKLDHGLRDGDVGEVLAAAEWLASRRVQERHGKPNATLEVTRDCPLETPGSDVVRDDPISFDQRHRQYGWRSVIRYPVTIPNTLHNGVRNPPDPHDPMVLLEGLN
ncbi:type I-E CRISPR-associated protein Cas5/CasD [Prauserella flavalba]|uniref:Type I-E CRISPR-associated protein Cas5/CasD n=1 Tax=Prauserella flavalba TaxID=1477506 RepID=A0A318LGC3_9PSEU|nr:type I-E CRISPR-associated protein Cas5/CasD [Prauserella flavalba]PXY18437.1 type I-E CRISPR-associated protein Cas5/CasD [Prauserella flavalba]